MGVSCDGAAWWEESRSDWAAVVFTFVVLGAVEEGVWPRHRHSTCEFGPGNVCNATSVGWDATLANPWAKHETVPVWLLLFIAYGVPLVTVGVYHFWRFRCARDGGGGNARGAGAASWRHDGHHFALALLAATGVTLVVTSVAKRYVGYYRPSYYSLVGDPDESDHAKRGGRQSFPSGHASLSFSSMATLTLWSLGKTRALARGPGCLHRVIGCLSFTALAGFVAASRIVDYRHHPADVNAGAGLGLACAVLCYHVYYPPVWCADGYLPRSADRDAADACCGYTGVAVAADDGEDGGELGGGHEQQQLTTRIV